MSTAAVAATTAIGVITWVGLGTVVAIAIGRTIRRRDAVERPGCCPHPESDAPATVRGEFRPLVIQ